MSEHHRGAWGGAGREDAAAVWWPGAITSTADAQQMHQHLLNQQHQQQLQQHQQQLQQQQLQQNTSQGQQQTQQIFTYKMASSFQNPASTAGVVVNNTSNQSNASNNQGGGGGGGTTVVTSNSPYDYRLGMANMLATAAAARQQSEQQQQQQLQQQTTQWWYANQQQQNLESAIQQQQQQQNQHNLHNVHTPPPSVCKTVEEKEEIRELSLPEERRPSKCGIIIGLLALQAPRFITRQRRRS